MSAWASTQRLVLGQEAVEAKDNECAAILAILERLAVKGALVTIDAIATNPAVAKAITDDGGDYVLALKRNQPTLQDEVASILRRSRHHGAPPRNHRQGPWPHRDRRYSVSHDVDWLASDRRHPQEPRFPALAGLTTTTTELNATENSPRHSLFYLFGPAHPERAAEAIRDHWGIENMHWVLDMIFKEDQSRLRRGHGARNMALVRRLAFNLVRAGKGNRSIKTARKAAGWNPDILQSIVTQPPR